MTTAETSSEQKLTSYDAVPYPSKPFSQSHPDRLATIAHLFGLDPRPIDRCRVLELGCASGDNIIPMAEQLPGSTFIGVDLSERQVATGRRFLERTGLQNVDLRQMNIMDVNADLGQFDYIIVHGIYSWVPATVQDKILEICASNLAPHGIAYISYNTYPGWHMRGMIRDMMCYHVRRFDDPKMRIQQARGLLDFLAQNTPKESAYGKMLQGEVETLRGHEDGYLFHDHLEENNVPLYFYQFIERAQAKCLEYVGEAEMSAMWAGHLSREVATTLQRVASDLIQMEQYTDFVRNRMFRQTLLCHQDLKINRELKAQALESLYVSSLLAPEDPKHNILSGDALKFERPGGNGANLSTGSPLVKAVLIDLAEAWPQAIPFRELLPKAYARLDAESIRSSDRVQQDTEELAKLLFRSYLSNLVEFHLQPGRFVATVSAQPLASAVARTQAELNYPFITNLRHEGGRLDALARQVLRHLDGKHDREGLLDILVDLVEKGILVPAQGRRADQPQGELREYLAPKLDKTLANLARMAFCLG